MVTNNAKISVDLPTFNREKIHIYIKELKMWSFITTVEKKQGFLVWMSLPMNNVKKAINNEIGMDDLCKDDGMDKILRLLRMIWREKEYGAFLRQEEVKDFEQGLVREVDIGNEKEDVNIQSDLRLKKAEDDVLEQGDEGKKKASVARKELYTDLRQEEVDEDENEQGDEGKMVKMLRMETKVWEMEQELISFKSDNDLYVVEGKKDEFFHKIKRIVCWWRVKDWKLAIKTMWIRDWKRQRTSY